MCVCLCQLDTRLCMVQAVTEFKAGKVEYRADKTGIVHLSFGKANFKDEDLLLNLAAVTVSA